MLFIQQISNVPFYCSNAKNRGGLKGFGIQRFWVDVKA